MPIVKITPSIDFPASINATLLQPRGLSPLPLISAAETGEIIGIQIQVYLASGDIHFAPVSRVLIKSREDLPAVRDFSALTPYEQMETTCQADQLHRSLPSNLRSPAWKLGYSYEPKYGKDFTLTALHDALIFASNEIFDPGSLPFGCIDRDCHDTVQEAIDEEMKFGFSPSDKDSKDNLLNVLQHVYGIRDLQGQPATYTA